MTRSRLRAGRADVRTAHGVGNAGLMPLSGCGAAQADPCPLPTLHRRSFRLYRGIALCAGFL
ncbi:MAG TPA: hypothetical protein VLQ68_03080 [Rhizobiaceae bacterium]|nr:hypothetical protein [Rhizobiaceae bacterium]